MRQLADLARINRASAGLLIIISLLVSGLSLPRQAYAAASLVQVKSTNTGSSVASISYSPTPVSGDLLIVICSTDAPATITGPAGFSTAINEAGDPAMGIFYKASAGNETSVSCSFSAGGAHAIQIYEYSGMENVSPLDAVNTTTSSGSSAPASTGTLTTLNTNDLLIGALTSDAGSGVGSWTNSFTQETSTTSGGKPSTRLDAASADLSVSGSGSYSSAPVVQSGSNWRGQIAAFKISPAIDFGGDIVDSSTGTPIASPSVSLTPASVSFACQTATGTLPASGESIRITNTTPSNSRGWTLALAASSPNWSDGSGNSYAYNNSAGSPAGCASGQLSLVPTSETITPESSPEYGCSTAGVSPLGTKTGFSGTTPITIASANSSASYYCYWDVAGIGLSQAIPAEQRSGSYFINLTLTLTAL